MNKFQKENFYKVLSLTEVTLSNIQHPSQFKEKINMTFFMTLFNMLKIEERIIILLKLLQHLKGKMWFDSIVLMYLNRPEEMKKLRVIKALDIAFKSFEDSEFYSNFKFLA